MNDETIKHPHESRATPGVLPVTPVRSNAIKLPHCCELVTRHTRDWVDG